MTEQDAAGSLAARLESEFRERGVEPPRFLGLLADIDPRFEAYLEFPLARSATAAPSSRR